MTYQGLNIKLLKLPSFVFIYSLLKTLDMIILYTNIDQKLMNSLHGLLNCEIGGLSCHEYRTRVHSIHMYHLFCNALVHVIYLGISGQCSHTIPTCILGKRRTSSCLSSKSASFSILNTLVALSAEEKSNTRAPYS